MELFVMITVQKQHDSCGPVEVMHQARAITVDPGTTRINTLQWAIAQLPERLRDATIVFFSAEPNRINVASPARIALPADV